MMDDDKDGPYSKSYSTKPSLPPFSSLRPSSSTLDGSYSRTELDGGYGTSLSQYQQQQQLYPFVDIPYLQGHPSHYHQQPQPADFPLGDSTGGLQKNNQPPQLRNFQSSSFHGSTTQGSHFQVKNESHFHGSLQHPPIPDMSLRLPFPSGQSGMLASSHLPAGIHNFSDGRLFQSNTDHPPQIPLSQVETLLTEAEQQKSSDFNISPKALKNHDINSSWQPSCNPRPAQPSEQLPSFSSFSSFYSGASNTKHMYFTSELPSKVDSYNNRYHIPESINSFTASTSSIPGYTSQYQVSGNSYSGNYFIQKQASEINPSDIPYSSFNRVSSNHIEQNNMFHMCAQNSQITPRNESQESHNVAGDIASVPTKGGRKGRRNKKLSEKNIDAEVKSLTKKKRPKTLKKTKCQLDQESLVALPTMNSDNDSASPTFCLSPTFIASLSSKRATDSQPSNASHAGPCVSQQSSTPQRCHTIPGVHISNLLNYHSSENNTSYFTAQAAPHNKVSGSDKFPNNVTSQMYNASVHPSVKSSCQENRSRNEPKPFSHQTNFMYAPNINTESKPSKNIFNESHLENEEEEKSLSPFQLSPGFIASLSSKRAEGHPEQKSVIEATSLTELPLESQSRPLTAAICDNKSHVQRQQISADHAENELPYSSFHNSFVKQTNPPTRIQLHERPDLFAPLNASFQKSQECNIKNMSRQTSSPKQYVSPPAYTQGSEFQYPTPPMDDDESKLQSPGLCVSPKFLDNLSNKIASGELSHQLTPTHDDNASVLPTPPNSAGPKQPYLPDITLSKEEQTSRILEIIAREREKVQASTYQSSPLEPKRKKKKKRSNDVGNSDDYSKLTSNQFSKQIEQHIFPYCSESSANSNAHQKYHEMQLCSLLDYTSTFGKLSNGMPVTNSKGTETSSNKQFQHKPIQQQQMILEENDSVQFDSKEEKPKFTFSNSEGFRIVDMCSKNEILQRHRSNLQNMECENYTGMSQKADVISFNKHLYRPPSAVACQNSGVVNHFPLQKLDSTPKLSEKDLIKPDPYAFDDSEQTDINISLKRSMKPVTDVPCMTQTKQIDAASISQLPCAKQSNSQDITVPFTAAAKLSDSRLFEPINQQFYSADHTLTRDQVHNSRQLPLQQLYEKTSHSQQSHQMPPEKVLIENEISSVQINEFNQNINIQQENQHQPQLINSTTHILKDHYYQKMQDTRDHTSLQNTSGISFHPEGSIVKQESHNLSHHSTQQMMDHQTSLPDSFNIINGHMSDKLKQETNESLSVDVKKKRGRPPKHVSSTYSPVKPKVPKLLHEKKFKIQSPKKLVYSLNGAEVNSSDLNLNQDLVDRLTNNLVEVADCSCLGPDHIPSETTEGPYYTQLGAAKDIPGVRKVLEKRTGISGSAIRIEKVIFTGKEGKSKEGCPIAKWIIRRSGPDEKYLCIVRKRPGHFCDTAVIIMVIVAWEGVDRQQADNLYDFLISTLPQNGLETDRRCGLNEKKTCACQGVDLLRRGASFSFGCSWSMYYNGCKFARSQMARKFKMKDVDCEDELEDKLQKLATDVAPLYSQLAPDAFRNQTQFEKRAYDCRLGKKPGQPFSGVTAVVDFCCHSHRDCHNMNNGSTVVVNLTKHRGFEKPEDEQYHVLPLYILDQTDEHGSMEGQMTKVSNGSLEVLSRYMSQVRRRSTPYRPCQRNRTTPKKQGLKKSPKKSKMMKAKMLQEGDYPSEASSKSGNSSFSEDGFLLPQTPSIDKINNGSGNRFAVNMAPGVGLDERNPESMSYTDLMSQQGTPGFGNLYSKFWDYFYTHGEFPPCEWMSKKRFSGTSKAAKSSLTSDTLFQPMVAGQIFLHHQQWQHQEQRKSQQHNIQNQAGQSEQQENHRQQNVPSCLAGKQDFHSPSMSPHSQYPQTSSRQQHHSQSYQCEVPVSKSSQLHVHSSSFTPHQRSLSQQKQSCIPTPVPSSIPLTSSKQQLSETSSTSDQSNVISSTLIHQLKDNRSSLLPVNSNSDHFCEENCAVSLHSNSQNNLTCKSPIIVSHAPSGGCDEHSVKPPPSYHQSLSNQHNMQCGPSEALCSFKPQGLSPPSYSESLAQSAHNIINNLNDTQGDMHALRFSSNNSVSRSQLGPCLQTFNHTFHYSNPKSVVQPQMTERPQFEPVLQRSFNFNPHERPPSTSLGSELFVSRPLPPKSTEEQNSELPRPPSSQSLPRSFSIQSMERPQSTQSIPENVFVQSVPCPTSEDLNNGLTQSVQQPCTLYKSRSSPVQIAKRPASAMSVGKPPISEHSTSRPISFEERRQSFHSLDNSLLTQRQQESQSGKISPSQSLITSSPCFVNQPHCYQRDSLGANSSMQKSNVEHNNTDSLKSNFIGNHESSMTDTPNISTEIQVQSGRGRNWSKMSDPATVIEVARPSSCSTEPGHLSGWTTELPLIVASSNISVNRNNSETWPCAGPNTLHSSFNNSSIVKLETVQGALNSELKDKEFSPRQEISNIKELNCFSQSAIPKIFGNNLQQSFMQSKERIPNELNYGGFVNGQAGTVCPNGPVIGEKMKVHKSEGFVVPKLGRGPSEPPYEVIDSTVTSEEIDDNREAFNDPAMGGVAIALCHGAVLFEVAKIELHATTALKEPNRYQPKRISLVFYQHKNLNLSRHGFDEYERKIEERRSQAEQARLIEEMESKGFLKGELSELASFPNLTKGTFGKVFNFPESRETLFPLRFPRYLDCSHSEQITPVMFACMSIAFPKYMREAFPNPAKLPRLISSHMPGRIHSSLSDRRRDFKQTDSETGNKELQFLEDLADKNRVTFQRALSPWNPNLPRGNTMTTDRVITRWVHDDVIVTGPYNRWVELILQDTIKKEEVETEADLKEKMFESLSQLDSETYISSNRDVNSDSVKYSESIMKTFRGNEDTSSTPMIVNLEPDSSDLGHPACSDRSPEKEIDLKQFSIDDMKYIETFKNVPTLSRVSNDSNKFSKIESPGTVNNRLESCNQKRVFDSRMQPDPENHYLLSGSNEFTEKDKMTTAADSYKLLRNGEAMQKPLLNSQMLSGYNQMYVKASANVDRLKASVHLGESSSGMGCTSKTAIKDATLGQAEYAITECLPVSGYNSVITNPVNQLNSQCYTSRVDKTLEENGCKFESERLESTYDFLIKGLNRQFLTNQSNLVQNMQDEFPTAVMKIPEAN